MPFAQGSRSDLSYVVESSFGVTPSSPAMIDLPFSTHSLNLAKERVQGSDNQSDRMPRTDRHGNRSVAGDIVADLRATDYDDLLESGFFSLIDSTGVMKIGTTPKFMSFEDGAQDITQFRQFSGLGVSSIGFSIAPNQMVKTTFSMVGKDMIQAQTPLDATPTDASGNEPFDSFSGEIRENDIVIGIVTSVDFSITNSLSPNFVVGSQATPQLSYGMAVVEGTLSAYYEDNALIDKFINEVETSLQATVTDLASGNNYTFLMPRVKLNGSDIPHSDPQSRTISIPFVSLYDVTEATNLKLTKS